MTSTSLQWLTWFLLTLLLLLSALSMPTFANEHETGNQTEETTEPPPDESVASSTSFQRSGILSCDAAEFTIGSVGAFAAIAGIYVPVNDAAVTLNTASLVYKECILDVINRQLAEGASSGLVSQGLNNFLTGRDGKPLWPEEYRGEVRERADRAVLYTLESGQLNTLNPAIQNGVVRATALSYRDQTRESNRRLGCPYSGNLETVLTGKPDNVWAGLLSLTNPACNPLGAYHLAQEYLAQEIAEDREEFDFRLETAQGIYGVQEYDPLSGRYITKTPGSLVAGNIQQIITSGFRQLENAEEVGELVGALFSGLSTQSVSDGQGLKGLLTSNLGQPSYLEQMARESSQGIRDSVSNAALQILNISRQVEKRYHDAMAAMAQKFIDTTATIRAAEAQCWNIVIENVCATALSVSNTCTSVPPSPCTTNTDGTQTCPTGVLLQVATTTARSQQVIDAQITPLAQIVAENLNKSEQALERIDRLIAGVTNTTSLEAQRLALLQLDGLVAQKLLHNQYEAQEAEKQQTSITTQMTSLAQDTVTAWGDSIDIETGWCNVNNFGVIEKWIDTWRK